MSTWTTNWVPVYPLFISFHLNIIGFSFLEGSDCSAPFYSRHEKPNENVWMKSKCITISWEKIGTKQIRGISSIFFDGRFHHFCTWLKCVVLHIFTLATHLIIQWSDNNLSGYKFLWWSPTLTIRRRSFCYAQIGHEWNKGWTIERQRMNMDEKIITLDCITINDAKITRKQQPIL